MACSSYEYVRKFEHSTILLADCWIVIRLDGRGFSNFAKAHEFVKPSDDRCLMLMTAAAGEVMVQNPDIILAYGHSDEYSFVFKKSCTIWRRREAKFISTVVSLFSSTFVFLWPRFFPQLGMKYPPTFDARAICYPHDQALRDYLSWRQVDCHVNNQYNYCFWSLVEQGGCTPEEAYEKLKGSTTAIKNEMLFSSFGINYSHLPALHRKGTTLLRCGGKKIAAGSEDAAVSWKSGDGDKIEHQVMSLLKCFSGPVTIHYVDIIGKEFWEKNAWVLWNE